MDLVLGSVSHRVSAALASAGCLIDTDFKFLFMKNVFFLAWGRGGGATVLCRT